MMNLCRIVSILRKTASESYIGGVVVRECQVVFAKGSSCVSVMGPLEPCIPSSIEGNQKNCGAGKASEDSLGG
jgi:hypothetical protein